MSSDSKLNDVSKQQKSKIISDFKEFFKEYYDERIKSLTDSYERGEVPSLTIDYRKLKNFNGKLARGLNEDPDIFYTAGEEALQSYLDEDILNEAKLRLIHHNKDRDNVVEIRSIRGKHTGKMISIEGIVKTSSKVLQRATKAAFKCRSCGSIMSEQQPTNAGDLIYPYECNSCNTTRKNAFKVLGSKTEKIDFQKIVVEEPPEELKGGQNPRSINTFITGDIAGKVTPGDKVTVTGILRSDNSGDNPIFVSFLEANSIDKKEKEFEDINITEEDEEKIIEFSKRDDLYDVLSNSVAPSIYGHENIKRAVALQLFSGVSKEGSDGRIRGDIHTLIVGDPGTGKSEIIRSGKELAPRGVYAVGKGTSTAGLTASAVKDSTMSGEQEWTLEAGALVLADKGIACVDEIDKMSDDDRSALHEALQQQTVSVNKAGINATLKSRCSLLAAANPIYGRFDEYETVAEQIDLDPALFSRFDLVFTVTDKPDEEHDEKLAEHIIETNQSAMKNETDSEKVKKELEDSKDVYGSDDVVGPDFLQKYIAYARQNSNPIVTNTVKEQISDFYKNLRKEGGDDGPVAVTPREVQSVVRLCEAFSRMRLGEKVEKEDIRRAIEIKEATLEDVGVDPVSGELDADVVESGTSSRDRKQIRDVKEALKELGGDEDKVEKEKLIEWAESTGREFEQVERQIMKLKQKGELLEPENEVYKLL